MKHPLTILFLLFIISPAAQAVHFKVSGKNHEVLFEKQFRADLKSSLGKISLDAFAAYDIPFTGGENGISSLFELGNAMEVISDSEMKAYGWCFSVDGEAPDLMGDQIFIANQDAEIHWYYAYAHYKAGKWIGACVVDEKS